MCVRATITQDFLSFIKINEENKAMATGQQFTWQHHYIQTLAHNLPGHTTTSQQFTWPYRYRPHNLAGLTARLTLTTQYTWPHSYRPHSLPGHTARL